MIVQSLLGLSGVPAYGLVAALAAGEAAAFVGLVLPGEAALLLGGVLASQGRVSLPVMIAVAVLAAVVGDSIGYEVGRRGGPALQRSRLGRFVGAERWETGEAFLARRGAPAVFFGRWVGVLRALVPSLAGMGRMPYRRFLLWNALGGLVWASTVVLVGYCAGAQYKRVEMLLGRASLLVGLAVLGLGGGTLLARSIARHPEQWRARARRLRSWAVPTWLRRRLGGTRALVAARFRPARELGLLLGVGMGVAVTAGAGFALALEDVLDGGGVARMDLPVLRFLAAHRDAEVTAVARAVTLLGGVPFVLLVTAAVAALLWTRRRRSSLLLVGSVLGSGVLTATVKLLVARDRPALPLAVDTAEQGFSFPSGHSLSALVLYGTLAYLATQHLPGWRHRVYTVSSLLAVAVAVAFSRLYLGYHWLSDVLGSWTLAVLWLTAVITADQVLTDRSGRVDAPAAPDPGRVPEPVG